ncbi:hypothetical protein DL96DRAFT_83818 [Flagelloscypha sp. PMI_526]|nr:hypothetical protein DL96DRAFT_83818 [Flagelloscypha sp. PMI_526]
MLLDLWTLAPSWIPLLRITFLSSHALWTLNSTVIIIYTFGSIGHLDSRYMIADRHGGTSLALVVARFLHFPCFIARRSRIAVDTQRRLFPPVLATHYCW